MNSLSLVHLIALLAGIIIILLIRKKYPKMRKTELIGIIILYVALVLIFTEPVVNLIKELLA